MEQRAIIYLRVSSEKQGEGYSLDTQRALCRRYCDERAYTVAAEFVDEYTGTTHERPALSDLLDTLTADGVDVVIAWDLDRLLGRDELGQVLVKYQILDAGARIEYARDGSGHTLERTDSDMLTGLKAIVARQENADRAERARRGQRGRAESGNVMTTGLGPPYGYDAVAEKHRGTLVINEEQAAVVQLMYHMLNVEGLSTHVIAQRLHEKGIPTAQLDRKQLPSTAWNPTTVRKILANPVYRGEWCFGRSRRTKRRTMTKPDGSRYKSEYKQVPVDPSEWIRVTVPAIVDASTWETAQRRMAENKRYARPAAHPYLLRGLIVCPSCGCRWCGISYKGGRLRYYRCAIDEQPWRPTCSVNYVIRADVLETVVWDFITGYLLDPDRLIAHIDERRENEAAERAKYAGRRRAIEAELAGVDRKLSELLDQELDGYPASVIENKKRQLLARRPWLVEQLQEIAAAEAAATITPDVVDMLMKIADTVHLSLPLMTFEERRQLLRALRVCVHVIDKEHVRVTGVMSSEVLSLSSTLCNFASARR